VKLHGEYRRLAAAKPEKAFLKTVSAEEVEMLGTLRDSFVGNVQRWPDRMAVIGGERTYTYGNLNASVNQFANFLIDLGVRKGDTVGLFLNNCAEFAIGFLACQKLGAVSSGLNYRLSAGAVGYTVQQEKLKALVFNSVYSDKVAEMMKGADFCRFIGVGNPIPQGALPFNNCESFPATAPPSVDIQETDLCNVIHTSGTTGRPKGAAFTNGTQIITAIQYCLEMGLDRGHVGMSLAPVVIGAATNFFVAYLFVGAAQVMIGDYDAGKALRLIAQHKVTELFAVPTQMYQLAEAKQQLKDLDTSSLRLIRSGGSPLPKTLLQRVRSELGCEVLNTYGTTESCTAITNCHTGLEPEAKWESIGRPSYFQEVRVIKTSEGVETDPDQVIAGPGEGQLINRGAQSIAEYYCTPLEKLRARGGWQYARDIVRVDSDGYIFPVDRIDNLIISGGENIYPQEVEFFLSKHPAIVDVAVFGVPDEKWGQVVKALIVRRDPKLTAEDIDRYCLASHELPRYRRPKIIEFVDALPRNVLGKLDRTALH
jgi:long-chain acyl-CoA synthetase